MRSLTLIIPVLLITLTSCSKEESVFIPDAPITGPDTTWYSRVTDSMSVVSLRRQLKPSFDTGSFIYNPGTNFYLTLPSGIVFSLLYGSFRYPSGQNVTAGEIQFETVCIRNKGDMIRHFVGTSSNLNLLNAGGLFYVRFYKDGQALVPSSNFKMKIQYNSNYSLPASLNVYSGTDDFPFGFSWTRLYDFPNNVEVYYNPTSIEVHSNKLGWILAGAGESSNTGTCTVIPKLDAHFTNANTQAFLVFNNQKSVVSLEADYSSRRFKAMNIPGNKSCQLLVMAKMDNDYYFAKTSLQTLSQGGEQLLMMSPVRTPLTDIQAELDLLR